MKRLVIILLGPPGVGKGSQATKIASHFKIPHLSTGDLLRENIKAKTALGNKAESIIKSGNLVSDDLINEMIFVRLSQDDCKHGYLLDGFPRTLFQAEVLDEYLKNKDFLVKVFHFHASNETVVTRISGRLVCKSCGSVFHTEFKKPKSSNTCDNCSSPLYQRQDDSKEVVLERLKVYEAQTSPLIHFYEKKHLLHTINCEKAEEEIFKETLRSF